MKLSSIAAELRRRWPDCVMRLESPECDLNGITLGNGSSERTGMLHVYLSASAEIAAGCAVGECCLCLVDCNAANLILAPDEQTLEQMVNLIESLFARLQELSRLYQTTLTRRLNLQSIVRQATDILDNPMLVADPNNEIVAMSEVDWDDSAWQRFQEQRCLPYHPDIEACSSIQIMLLAAYDLGVGFVPKEFVRPEDGVAVIDLKEEIPTRSVCLVNRKEQSLSIAARELERMILETAK